MNSVNASAAQVLENRLVKDLPTISNSVILQAGLAVGMQRLAFNNVNLSFTNASSNHRASGSVGGNEWSIDGTPNSGQMRRAAYLPFTDAIQEMRVESMSFDATVGNNSGAFIMMTTKAGTNDYHGTLNNTHWQQRWHATSSNDNGVYWGRIRAAELATWSAPDNCAPSRANLQADPILTRHPSAVPFEFPKCMTVATSCSSSLSIRARPSASSIWTPTVRSTRFPPVTNAGATSRAC